MSVIAIHPRTPSPGGPGRNTTRRRPVPSNVPTLRLTLELPLAGERLPAQLALLLELARDLADQGDGTLAVTGVADPSPVAELLPVRTAGADRAAGSDGGGSTGGVTDAGGRSMVGADETDRRAVGATGVGGAIGHEPVRLLTGPRVVLRDGLALPLTRLEFDLLLFLARHPRRVFTRTQLLAGVWGYQHAVARTVDVHVRRLRAKVGDGVPLVTTVHGVGYRLADDARVRVEDLE
ncbi:winged helix-turn-helix domain-containing protein [Plantactinospora sonchi]|uniref:Winged helix-turn-helix domain-containing protein n=1 Tax=Plantactinospora sonchi TaxID=1544735 RepID=A0ABU7RTL2_9ACTN